MKTKEELNALKEEGETMNKKLAELTEEELAQVCGGAKRPTEDPGEGLQWYQIKPQETLVGIAKNFGTDYKYLARINNIPDPNLLRAGKWIRVPA